MKRVVVLGSTGSIGESTLRVVDALPEQFRITGLGARQNAEKLVRQAVRYGVKKIALLDAAAAEMARRIVPADIRVYAGTAGMAELAASEECDIVVSALVGMAGLIPTLAAIEAGHDTALATKEVLVAAGELVMRRRLEKGVRLLPVDSEHSALFQCLQSASYDAACIRTIDTPAERAVETRIAKLILTASGGPFFSKPEIDFDAVTPEQALAHPKWKMGMKVSVDSATMMNKGLEMIEACHLFNVHQEQVEITVHPESIIHSLVRFTDGGYMAQLSPPDMRFPIQFALTYPVRSAVEMPDLDLAGIGALHFAAPDEKRFPMVSLARVAVRTGGTLPAVMNAANEVAVEAFLKGKLRFSEIARHVESAMEAHRPVMNPDLETILEFDVAEREKANRL